MHLAETKHDLISKHNMKLALSRIELIQYQFRLI